MANKKANRGGKGKFFLGAAIGAAVGAIAGRLISKKSNECECGCGDNCKCGDECKCDEKRGTKA